MSIETGILAWLHPINGWCCAQCNQRLGEGPHICPIDHVGVRSLPDWRAERLKLQIVAIREKIAAVRSEMAMPIYRLTSEGLTMTTSPNLTSKTHREDLK